jgi:ATP-dependent Clp protease adaptor protein ClpS
MTIDAVIDKVESTKQIYKEPPKFKVVVFNDDYTPMEFVVAMFMSIFRKSETEAVDLTMKIHNQGQAVAGVYTSEIADQKASDATELARANSHPLVIKVEKE